MTTTAELQQNNIRERFEALGAHYSVQRGYIRVVRNNVLHTFEYNTVKLNQLTDLLKEWGETHE